jgi:hypothetical protein
MTRKRGIDQTAFSSSSSVTLVDQIQEILNDIGGLVPIVQGVTSTSLGLLVLTPNEGNFSAVEALLHTKLDEQLTVARFAELNIRLGVGHTVAVSAPLERQREQWTRQQANSNVAMHFSLAFVAAVLCY